MKRQNFKPSLDSTRMEKKLQKLNQVGDWINEPSRNEGIPDPNSLVPLHFPVGDCQPTPNSNSLRGIVLHSIKVAPCTFFCQKRWGKKVVRVSPSHSRFRRLFIFKLFEVHLFLGFLGKSRTKNGMKIHQKTA